MILFIEDRTSRQTLAFLKLGISLDKYKDIVENAIDESYEEIFKMLKEDRFDFSKYSFIICHKSAFDDENSKIISKLKQGCSCHDIPLVLFSGGIDANYHDTYDKYAEINSKTLYSHNLKLFFENAKEKNIDIFSLIYGEKWKLNILLNLLEKINLFVQSHSGDRVYFKRFSSDVGLDIVGFMDIGKPEMQGKYTTLSEIKKISTTVEEEIKVVIDE